MDLFSSIQRGASRLAHRARNSIDATATEFETKGVGGVLRESFEDTAETIKEISYKAKTHLEQGVDAAATWVAGDDDLPPQPPHARSLPSRSGTLPVWKPPVIQPVPRLEDLRKGMKVLRRGALAEVVKVDLVADPPALVVRMFDGGNEVGTDATNVSLDIDASMNCLTVAVRVLILNLQSRKELNGCRGTLQHYKADVARWNVKLDSGEVVSVKPRNLSVLLKPSAEASSPSRPSPVPVQPELPSASPASGRASPSAGSSGPPAHPSRSEPAVRVRKHQVGEDDQATGAPTTMTSSPVQRPEGGANLAANFLGSTPHEVRIPSATPVSSAVPQELSPPAASPSSTPPLERENCSAGGAAQAADSQGAVGSRTAARTPAKVPATGSEMDPSDGT